MSKGKIPWIKITISIVMAIFVVGTLNMIYHAKERIEKLIVLEHGAEALRTGSPYQEDSNNTAIPGMAYIPGGEYRMGNNKGNPDEGPVHKVRVKPFYMDEKLVTNEEYKKFLDATGRKEPPHWRGKGYPKDEEKLPVCFVSFYDADAYARWAGKRIPTEAEWEFAARGGEDYLWPWGNQWDDKKANTNYRYNAATPVDRFREGVNGYGLYDMAGNLFQWTSSPYQRYPGNTLEDWWYAKGLYAIRGGSWKSDIYAAKSTRRNAIPPESIAEFVGFRCAKDF